MSDRQAAPEPQSVSRRRVLDEMRIELGPLPSLWQQVGGGEPFVKLTFTTSAGYSRCVGGCGQPIAAGARIAEMSDGTVRHAEHA